MKMKDRFRVISLFAAFLVSVLGVSPHVTYAHDVWVYNNESWSVYLDSDTVKTYDTRPQYQCNVKIISNDDGSQVNFWICGFHPKNGEIIAYQYSRSQGFWERIGPLHTTPEFAAIWHAMQDYL